MISAFYKKKGGFTLIELLIVIAIIGILAAIAIPQFTAYRKRSYNASAKSDVKNAYTAAQAYFSDNPTGEIKNISDLTAYGFKGTSGVKTEVKNGTIGGLEITAKHDSGDKEYSCGPDGVISEKEVTP